MVDKENVILMALWDSSHITEHDVGGYLNKIVRIFKVVADIENFEKSQGCFDRSLKTCHRIVRRFHLATTLTAPRPTRACIPQEGHKSVAPWIVMGRGT